MQCFVFPYETAEGYENMALDEALLEAVSSDRSSAMLRTYGWTTPTLSLGYFQSISEAEADPRFRDRPIVRRPTGGGAIWHHHELTYALAMPADHPLARPGTALYHAVHGAVLSLLAVQQVEARPRGPNPTPGPSGRPFLCFQDRDPEDLVCGETKILGSAQRRRAGAILQHGSMLLERSDVTPELPGLSELGTLARDPMFWAQLLEAHLPAVLGVSPIRAAIPTALRRRARELEETVYRKAAWNRRR